MKVTEVRVFKMNDEKLKAYVSITIEGCLAIKGLKVINGAKGLFVAMPSQKGKDEKFHDIVFPINKEARAEIEKAVLEAYEKEAA
jgi:stage V sporulation protein G